MVILLQGLNLLKLSVEDEVLRKGPGVSALFGVFEPYMKKQGVESPTKRREGVGDLQVICFMTMN